MKKIVLLLIAVMMFILGGCNSAKEVDDFSKVDKIFNDLSSYSLTADMTIYKSEKEIKASIAVDYLKPSYYKVVFSTSNGHEQIIVKNTDGVYVLTPSLNKQFKFDSEWPLNGSHGYLIDALWKDIKKDTSMTYQVTDDLITITAKTNSTKFSKVVLTYNVKDSKPVKVEMKDSEDKLKVLISFKTFNLNPNLSSTMFNSNLIMDNNSNVGDGAQQESTTAITVGYVIDDTKLQSQKVTDDCTILCYGGVKNYTIIAKKIEIADDVLVSSITDYEILDLGLVLYSDNVSRYYVNDIEISLYSQDLSIDEVSLILSEIVTV